MSGPADFSLGVGADLEGATIPRLVARHFRARPRRVLAMLALALLLAGLAVVPPMVVARLVDGAIEGGVGLPAALLMVGAIALLAAADAGLTLVRRRLAVGNEIAMRGAVARAHFRTSVRLRFDDYAMGNDAALIRSFDDLDVVIEFVASRSVELFAEVTIIGAYAVLLLAVEPVLALCFLGLAAVGLVVATGLAGAARRACDAWLPVRDRRFAYVVECLTAMLAIKTLNAHAHVAAPFAEEQAREDEALRQWRLRMAMSDAANRFFAVATPGIGAAAGAILLLEGRITAGGLLLFLAVSAGLGGALAALHGQLQELGHAQASLARMRALRTRPPEALDAPASGAGGASGIRTEALGFRHRGAALDIFDGLELAFAPGEHIAIVGRSGEGKTTLAMLLARLYEADRGGVALGEARDLPPGEHRRRVLLVPAATSVFSASVRENLRLWDGAIDDAALWRALGMAELRGLVEGWSAGLDTELGARGNPLSSGQQQRLGLARAFLRDPDVLILDEASAAMDAQTEAAVLTAVRSFMAGRTLVVITHREAVAVSFPRVLRMEGGRLVGQVAGGGRRA